MSARDPAGPGGHDPRAERLAALAAELEVDLPPFEGPLVAFGAQGRRAPEEPVYLGGDLHAVHPESRAGRAGQALDRSLDAAEITITNFEHPAVVTSAREGLWCLALTGPILETAPYLGITDGEGRRRTWILLPMPPQMIGMGHYWLPAVPPLAESAPPRRPGRRRQAGEER